MLDVRSISKPCHAVTWGLPLCCHSNLYQKSTTPKTSVVECIHELADVVVKEPVSNGRVVGNCPSATGTAVIFVWTDETSQLGPLPISSTVSEEHSRHPQCVHHGDQPAVLLEPELAGPSKTAGKVHHSVGEEFPLMANHIMQII